MSRPWHIRIGETEGVAWKALQVGHTFELISSKPDHQEFWILVQNTFGESFCLLWSHLFGSRSDDLHCSKLFSAAETELGRQHSHEQAMQRIRSYAQLDEHGFDQLWAEVKACRDKFIAHRELNASAAFPHVDLCILIVEALRDELKGITLALASRYPDDHHLDGLVAYYRSNTNRVLRSRAAYRFQTGLSEAAVWLS